MKLKTDQRSWLLTASLAALAIIVALLLSFLLPAPTDEIRDRVILFNGRSAPALPGQFPGPPPPLTQATPSAGQPTPTTAERRRDGNVNAFFPRQLTGLPLYLAQLVSLLGFGLVILFLLPRQLAAGAGVLRQSGRTLGQALLLGLLSYLASFALTGLAVISTIGGAAIALSLFLVLPLTILGIATAALGIGRALAVRLFQATLPTPFPDLLSGLLAIFILFILPVIGPLLGLLVAAVGIGGLLLNLRNANRTAFDELEY